MEEERGDKQENRELEPNVVLKEEVAEEKSMSFISRVVGIFIEPARVISDIAKKPDWLLPFILILALTGVYVFIAGGVIEDFAIERASESMQKAVDQGKMSQEQSDAIMEQQQKFIGMGIYLNTLLTQPLMRLLLAVALLFLGNIVLGGAYKFKHYWSLALYAGLIAAIGTVITGIIIAATGDIFGARLGLSILAQDPQSTLFKATTAFNVFLIWEAIIVGLGISKFADKPKANGIIMMLVLYLGIGTAMAFMIPGS